MNFEWGLTALQHGTNTARFDYFPHCTSFSTERHLCERACITCHKHLCGAFRQFVAPQTIFTCRGTHEEAVCESGKRRFQTSLHILPEGYILFCACKFGSFTDSAGPKIAIFVQKVRHRIRTLETCSLPPAVGRSSADLQIQSSIADGQALRRIQGSPEGSVALLRPHS